MVRRSAAADHSEEEDVEMEAVPKASASKKKAPVEEDEEDEVSEAKVVEVGEPDSDDPDEPMEADTYVVEALLEAEYGKGKARSSWSYLVKWLDYNDEGDDTWEPEKNVNSEELLESFWAGREDLRGLKRKGHKVGPIGSVAQDVNPSPAKSTKSAKSARSSISSPRKPKKASAPTSTSKRKTNGTAKVAAEKEEEEDEIEEEPVPSASSSKKRKAAQIDEDGGEDEQSAAAEEDDEVELAPIKSAPASKKTRTSAAAVASPAAKKPVGRPPRKSATPAVPAAAIELPDSETEDDASPAPEPASKVKAKKEATPAVEKAAPKKGRASNGRASVGNGKKAASPAATASTNGDAEVEVDVPADDEPVAESSSKKKAPVARKPRKSKLAQVESAQVSEPEDEGDDNSEVYEDHSTTNMDRWMDRESWEELATKIETIIQPAQDGADFKVYFQVKGEKADKIRRFCTMAIARQKFPQRLIDFYQGHLRFRVNGEQ